MTLLVLAAACGGTVADSDEPTTTLPGGQSTTAEDAGATTSEPVDGSSTTESTETTQAPEETDSASSDLPLAPDFTLELGTGGEYTLSSTNNPVFLVFWAEW